MTIHPLVAEDAPALAAVRQAASAHKDKPLGPEARPMFDAMVATTPAAADVRVQAATAGGRQRLDAPDEDTVPSNPLKGT